MSELDRLRNALTFLTQHLPGATVLAEIAEEGSVIFDFQRHEDADKILTGKEFGFTAGMLKGSLAKGRGEK